MQTLFHQAQSLFRSLLQIVVKRRCALDGEGMHARFEFFPVQQEPFALGFELAEAEAFEAGDFSCSVANAENIEMRIFRRPESGGRQRNRSEFMPFRSRRNTEVLEGA